MPSDGGRPDAAAVDERMTRRLDARAAAARRLVPTGEGNAALDRLTDLAAQLLQAPSAQISLLSDVQDVAAGTGAAPVGASTPLAESLCTVTMTGGAPLAVDDAVSDERVAALPPVVSGAVRAYLGVPLRTSTGEEVGALCVYSPEPRTWSADDVTLLERLAAPVVAELELAALSADYEAGRLVWQLAIDAGGIGAFDWDLRTDELRWDDRLLELFGLDRDSFGGTIDAFNARVHPDDLPQVTSALRSAIAGCGEYSAEYRVLLPDGHLRWIAARGRALCDEQGTAARVIGAAYDTTAVQDVEARVGRVLESMPTAFYHLDRQWRFSYVNAEAERLLGARREQLLGQSVWEAYGAAVGSAFEESYRQAIETGEPVAFDAYYPEPLNGWYELRAWPGPDGLSVYFVDITARRRAQAEAEKLAERTALLADVSAELTGELDADKAVARLATLLVPRLADWCLVTLVDGDAHGHWRRGLRDVSWSHGDPARRGLVERYAHLRVAALTDASFVARTLESGEPVVVHADARETLAAVLEDGEARRVFEQLDPAAVVVLPLKGRGRIVGLLTCFRDQGGAFDQSDLDTLREVAVRAGLALDNAQLFARQRALAEGLQRSLLTEPVRVRGVEIAVRYEPAAQAAQVGGDWYDSFVQEDGSLVVVVGDVVGHDTAAAAAMGQVRSLLRAIAVYTGEGPADVLRGVDRVVATLQSDTTATAVVAVLGAPVPRTGEPPGGAAARSLRWSNAGHPPPMLVTAAGEVRPLPGGDLLLGLDPAVARTEDSGSVRPGDTLVLYTDGLIERRGRSIDDGLAELRERLTALARERVEPTTLCARLVDEMMPGRREDDVALVAVRITAG